MKYSAPIASALVLLTTSVPGSAQQWISFTDVSSTDLVSQVGQPSLLTLGEIGSVDERTSTFAPGDFNQDGHMDVAVFCKPCDFNFSSVGADKPHVLLMSAGNAGLTDQTSTYAPEFTSHKTAAREAIAADMDGDGDLDLVVVNTNVQDPDLYENLGGTGSAWLGFARKQSWYLTEDGHTKFTEDDEVVQGTSTVAEMQGVGGLNGATVAAGDVDGDGDMDLLFGCYNTAHGIGGRAQDVFLENRGGLRFLEKTSTVLNMAAPNKIVMKVDLVDMDLDGALDIVMTNAFHQLCIQFNVNGVFNDSSAPPIFVPNAVGLYDHAVADFNGDGWPDLFSNGDGTDRTSMSSGSTPLAFSGGSGSSAGVLISNPSGTGTDVLSGTPHAYDFDGDGILDLGLSDMIKYGPNVEGCTNGATAPQADPFMFLKGRITDGSISALYDPSGTYNPPLVLDGVWDFVYFDGILLTATCQGLRMFRKN